MILQNQNQKEKAVKILDEIIEYAKEIKNKIQNRNISSDMKNGI